MSQAYEILKDPSRKNSYDSFKTAHSSGGGYNHHRSHHYYNGSYSNTARRPYDPYKDFADDDTRRAREEAMRAEYRKSRSQQSQSNSLGSLLMKVSAVICMIVGFQIYSATQGKRKIEYMETKRQENKVAAQHLITEREASKLGSSMPDRGESRFGDVIANNPLAFVKENRMAPEKLNEEMARKQFRIEHGRAEVRLAPDGDAIRKKWSKEGKKTIKDLDKFIAQTNLKISKSVQSSQ